MSSTLPSVINMVNTAFGVTVLAVPYCFHQCGIILGSLLLVISSYMSKKSCCLLLRSAQISRKRDFESLGLHVEGVVGKFIVEMSLIGYLGGTCIAWFVVIGDVAPAVLSSLFGIEKTWTLRMVLIIIIGVCGVLPLCLVKDINSLSNASNVAIGIYSLFVLQLFFSTLPKILSGEWIDVVRFWKPTGMFKCLPIFVISFLCQTVLFVIYEALQDPTVKKMEGVVNTAMDILLFLSTTVGFCGYVMFYKDGIQGDLLNNYAHDFISEFIRLGFCISTVLSFPLLVFPCRLSINSMISSAKSTVEGTLSSVGGTYIPHDRFFIITSSLVVGTLILGILFPNVEFVMALVGATMGASLTYILPSYIFIKVAEKEASKTEAKVLLVIGLVLFCMSTFAVLSMTEIQQPVVKISQVNPIKRNPVQPTVSSNSSSFKIVTQPDEKVYNERNDENKLKFPLQGFNKPTSLAKRREPVVPQERNLMSKATVEQAAVSPLDKPNLDKEENLNERKEQLEKQKEEVAKQKEELDKQKEKLENEKRELVKRKEQLNKDNNEQNKAERGDRVLRKRFVEDDQKDVEHVNVVEKVLNKSLSSLLQKTQIVRNNSKTHSNTKDNKQNSTDGVTVQRPGFTVNKSDGGDGTKRAGSTISVGTKTSIGGNSEKSVKSRVHL